MASHARSQRTQVFSSVFKTEFLYDYYLLLFVLHAPPISYSMNLPL
jgi:hypothetical protein